MEAGEEQETTDIETEKEIEVMNNSLGAEIRLLQLQKALLKNIFKGNMTIVSNSDVNHSTLKFLFHAKTYAHKPLHKSIELYNAIECIS